MYSLEFHSLSGETDMERLIPIASGYAIGRMRQFSVVFQFNDTMIC
jgi:hypothetical protein